MRLHRHPGARLVAGDDGGLLDILGAGLDLRADGGGLRADGGYGTWIEVATGGTTGAPKILRRSAQSWIASFRINARLFHITPEARVACLSVMGHSIALYALCEAAHLGAGLLALGGMRPDRQAQALRAHAATHLWLTPTQIRQIARHGPFPALRHVLVGGGALDGAARWLARDAFPRARIVPFYGASETSFITLDAAPYPGVEIALDERGLIRVRSPYLFDGYVSGADPDLRRDGDWISLGELGAFAADGALEVLGRVSRQVNIADRLVSPEAAERVLAEAAGAAVAVVALRDPARGHRLVAIREGAPDAALDARLLGQCRARIGAASTPHRMVALPVLPTLPSGKPDLWALTRSLTHPA
ncbi:AMP-binding protein [Maribius pontilimi]|uniref:AMP-binding protein n=1 Tax=Palleronia pontilimi TaxID=1964209 RepID=A0A934MD85_9RHOB|nr:AMP-binding protein [Palleronia pontilimi]MBJ3763623.1 AMP-binding protein [Palleronia pontilimi]